MHRLKQKMYFKVCQRKFVINSKQKDIKSLSLQQKKYVFHQHHKKNYELGLIKE